MTSQTVPLVVDERSGFPLLVSPEGAYQVGLLPLTWIQLEYFLSHTSDRRFDALWYQDLLARSARASVATVNATTWAQLFVRGLTLHETRLVGGWWGRERWLLPTEPMWQAIRSWAHSLPAIPALGEALRRVGANPRAIRLIEAVEASTRGKQTEVPSTLAEQMLLDNGVRELVLLNEASGAVGGIGLPHRSLASLASKPLILLSDGNLTRHTEVGFRLFLKA